MQRLDVGLPGSDFEAVDVREPVDCAGVPFPRVGLASSSVRKLFDDLRTVLRGL